MQQHVIASGGAVLDPHSSGGHHHTAAAVVTSGPTQGYSMPHGYHHKGALDATSSVIPRGGVGAVGGGSGQPQYNKQQTITIHDTPSPTAVITISDSEDESPQDTKRNVTAQTVVTSAPAATGSNNGK